MTGRQLMRQLTRILSAIAIAAAITSLGYIFTDRWDAAHRLERHLCSPASGGFVQCDIPPPGTCLGVGKDGAPVVTLCQTAHPHPHKVPLD